MHDIPLIYIGPCVFAVDEFEPSRHMLGMQSNLLIPFVSSDSLQMAVL